MPFTQLTFNAQLERNICEQGSTIEAARAATLRNVTSVQQRNAPVLFGTLRGSMRPIKATSTSDGRTVILSGSQLKYAKRQHYEHASRGGYLDPNS